MSAVIVPEPVVKAPRRGLPLSLPIWDDSPDVLPRVALCGTVWQSLGRALSPNLNPTNDFRPSPAYSGTPFAHHPRQAPRSTLEKVASSFGLATRSLGH